MIQEEDTSNANLVKTPVNSPKMKRKEKKIHITKRLEELNKWQEDQRRLLEERQNEQRKLLDLQQRSIYQQLGQYRDVDNTSSPKKCSYAQEHPDKATRLVNPACENNEEHKGDENYEIKALKGDAKHQQNVAKLDTDKALNLLSSTLGKLPDIQDNKSQIKRPFLKKGEGIKGRFKIDPNDLRLNNLPRYKFAKSHSRCAIKVPSKKQSDKQIAQKELDNPPTIQHTSHTMDLHEQRFREMLLNTKNVYNSTPEVRNDFDVVTTKTSTKSRSPSPDLSKQNESVKTNVNNDKEKQDDTCNQKIESVCEYNVAWPQTINPQSPKNRPTDSPCLSSNYYKEQEESIFELLEQKALEGSIDMSSPIIKKFIQRHLYIQAHNSDAEDDIPVQLELANKPLLPQVQDIEKDTDTESPDDEVSDSTDGEDTVSDCTISRTSCTDVTPTGTICAEAKVRFTDNNETRVFEESEYVDESAAKGDFYKEGDNEFFQQFKEAVFTALQIASEKPASPIKDEQKVHELSLIPKDAKIMNDAIDRAKAELEVKTNLIKARLGELENEIRIFKENNILLMKAKQQHELEKKLHAQEHLEAMEQIKDEKIQLEIYLHDERVKLEDEKRKFEQQVRSKAQASINKERKITEKLREQCAHMENQLKSKEQNHTSAQARVRCQVRNLEKQQKKLVEEVERLRKENKRLESENLKISREQNNKLLQEINRNIAKLAPKQGIDEGQIGKLQHKNVTKTSLEVSSNKQMHHSVRKNHTVPPKKLTKDLRRSCCKSASLQKRERLTGGFDVNMEAAMESCLSDESKEDHSFNKQEQKQQQGNNLPDQEEQAEKCLCCQTKELENDEDILEELGMVEKRMQTINLPKRSASPALSEGKATPPLSPSMNEIHAAKSIIPATPAEIKEMKRELINSDGSRDIWYPNGNLKKISADGMITRVLYYNKDIKETNVNEGTVKYYYAETNTWHTTYLDGLEILEFPNGQIEHRHKSGLIEIHYPDNSIKIINPLDNEKSEEWRLPDGTQLFQMRNGDRVLMLPNGQKEVHTKMHKRREYPDGTMKIIYPDGSQETRYSNGRIRLKDKSGKLLMDTNTLLH